MFVLAGLAALCLLIVGAVSVVSDPAPGASRRADRLLGAVGGVLVLMAVALYVHADARYQDCLDDGNHPWRTDHIDRGTGICDRAVFGDVLTQPRDRRSP